MNFELKLAILRQYPSQTDCAEDLGISESLLSKIVRERREPTSELKEALSAKLGVPSEKLWPQG
jgi:transcriptional regulator with XRE-family HTH domain